jgi:signal transduction histidine kinase
VLETRRAYAVSSSGAYAPAVDATPVRWPTKALAALGPLGRYGGGLALLIALYYGAAHLGFALEFAGPVAAVVWLPVGVGIAFLYLGGLKFWPGVVVGDLLVNNYTTLPFGSALGQSFGNLLEVVAATLLLRRLDALPSLSPEVGRVVRMLIAVAAGVAISATVGSVSLRAGGVITTGSLPGVWRTWWLGDFSGALLVVPLALAWWRPLRRPFHWRPALEGTIALVVLVGACKLAFSTRTPLPYIVFAPLIWTAFRLGSRGATIAVFIASGFAVFATTHYEGPFRTHSLSHAVLETQLFIAVASLSTLCLAAVVSDRASFARRLWASRARLVRAADTERRRLRRNLHDGAQQRLAGLMVRLDLAGETVQTPAQARSVLAAARGEIALAIEELRVLAHGRHPPLLSEQGLAAALRDLAERCPIRTELQAVPPRRLPEATEAAAYYVTAEAIANAQKYARPSVIRIRAEESGDSLEMVIQDDGIGGAGEVPGSGLEGLRDRVEAVGGTFSIDSRPGAGTRITARIPTTPIAYGD